MPRLLLAALLVPLAAPPPRAQVDADLIAEYARRLAGAERAEALDELRLLGRDGTDVLVGLLDVPSDAVAWDAVALFAELGPDGRSATKRLLALVEDEARPARRRGFAALALGAGGSPSAAVDLMVVLRAQPDPALSLPARVALANLGKAATTRAVQLMTGGESVFVRQWGAQVLYALGEDAYGARRELMRALEADEGYYLCATVRAALTGLGRRVERELAEAWEARRPTLARQMGRWPLPPAYATPNAKLIDFLRSKQAGGMANEPVPTERMPKAEEMSLPATFEDFNGDRQCSVGEVVMVWSRHLATEVARLRDALYVAHALGEPDAWRTALEPVVRSCVGQECLLPDGGRDAKR